MIDPSLLVDGVLQGVFGGRRKRSKNALRYLTGRKGAWLSNPQVLWTAAGLAWGVIETLQAGEASRASGASGASYPLYPPNPPHVPTTGPGVVPNEVLRLVRLAVSAANADGAMTDRERAAIARQAEASGGSDLVAAELAQPRPVAEIVAGVTDAGQRATLYVLAYTILRADEQISGAERIYLAQLANLLGLSPDDVRRIEQETGQRIDAQEGEK